MIAMLAPPWIPVPPPAYGGIESVIALLCDALVRRGNSVTLFAGPGSESSAHVHEVLPRSHKDEIGSSLYEADHVASAFEAIDQGDFDIIHDHCGFTAFAMADRVHLPLVHTLHGPFTRDVTSFYRRHSDNAHAVALSRAQCEDAPPELRIAAVIPNPVDADEWPFVADKQDYLLWIGRFDEVKGAHRAIAAARLAREQLVLAGPVQPGQEEYFEQEIEPHLCDQIRYVGEVGGEDKRRLYAGAQALLMPIRWREPFGMVMVEAMACGTPVIAFPEGSAPDVVRDGLTGYLVDDEDAMAAAVRSLGAIDPAACRAHVMRSFAPDRVAAAYEDVYERLSEGRTRSFTESERAGREPGSAPAPRVRLGHVQA